MGKRRSLDSLASLGAQFNSSTNQETSPMSEDQMPDVEMTETDAPTPVAPPTPPTVAAIPPSATQASPTVVDTSPGATRVATMNEKIETFIRDYPVTAPMTQDKKTVMLRQIEMMVNLLLASDTYQEAATHLSSLRAAFHANEKGVFSSARIVGHMRDPRTGRLNVSNPRTISIVSLIYMTANPKLFQAQRGRVDVATSLVGCPEIAAQFIMQYYA